MITTNKNNNLLLELEKHILKVLDRYSKSGDQFLNFPEKGVRNGFYKTSKKLNIGLLFYLLICYNSIKEVIRND